MKIRALLLLALAVGLPTSAHAQDTTSAAVQAPEPPPPAGLAAAETSRSKRCVPILARLDSLETKLEPFSKRADRLQALAQAILYEDSTKAVPFDMKDSVEVAVHQWFVADQALAKKYAATGDSATAAQRDAGRDRILKRLDDTVAALQANGQKAIAAAGDLGLSARECQGMILVRPAVLEACGTGTSALCRAARTTMPAQPGDKFHFVDKAEDLWDVESFQPWSTPQRLGPQSQGGLGGAQTATAEQRGNLEVSVSLEPLIRDRTQIGAADVAKLEANLDTLGIKYRNKKFVVVPALSVQVDVSEPLADETRYFLHFGDLSNPTKDVIWTASSTGHPLEGQVPATKAVLDRLAAGEVVSLTAVKFTDAAQKQAAAVYTIDLTDAGQVQAVANLVQYWRSDLGADFDALMPADAK